MSNLNKSVADQKMTEFLTVIVEDIREDNQDTEGADVVEVLRKKAAAEPEWRGFFLECFQKILHSHPEPEFFKVTMTDSIYAEYQHPKNKKTAVGSIEWLAALVKRNLVNKDIVNKILDDIFSDQHAEPLKVEVWCKLISGCGNKANTSQYFDKLATFKNKGSRVRSMIIDLEELQRNNWDPRN